MADTFIYRTDHIGSLLKPAALSAAEAAGVADLEAVQDREIAAAVTWQRDLGLSVVTDGEFRRAAPWSVLTRALSGLHREGSRVVYVTAPLKARAPLAAHEAQFLKGLTGTPVKVCLPAPGMLAEQLFRAGSTETAYRSVSELGTALAQLIRAEILALIAGGVRYIQLDNCAYTAALADQARFERILAIDSQAVQGIERPDGVCVALYLGRGGAERSVLFEKGCAPQAERLLGSLDVDRFVLDIDEGVSDFSILRAVPKGRAVALGLVSTRSKTLENADSIVARIDKAAEHFEADSMALCPQTGFAGLENVFSIADQKRKLELTASAATRCWGFGM
jgi:5-methyltetrahydropteroyltriglutamate--homocysteine methyltransferase